MNKGVIMLRQQFKWEIAHYTYVARVGALDSHHIRLCLVVEVCGTIEVWEVELVGYHNKNIVWKEGVQLSQMSSLGTLSSEETPLCHIVL